MKNEMMGSLVENLASKLDRKHSSVRSVVLAALAVWLGFVTFLAYDGAFIGSADSPPLPIFLGVAIPLSLFLAAYFGWREFRTFILGADLRLVTAMQGWRWGGLGFLSLYAHGILPGLFAFPAGLGDMAIGFTAPWVVTRLIREPTFAASRRYRIWNYLEILDFVVAISMGTLSSGFFHGIIGLLGNITTSPMTRLPLVLIPAYMVPLFTMLHLTSLFQARQLAAAASTIRKKTDF